jgi:ABC-type uncharacterized transport system substrate-binding protein
MRRREFISLLGGALTAWPFAAQAQQREQMRRIGVLIGFAESDPDVQSWLAAFRGALAKLGWTEGSNLRIELRWAGDPDRMKTFAKELVDLRPDAILSVTTPVTGALVRETQTIPIVIATVADPISSGFVTNLGRPGGNVTGFALYEPSMGGKCAGLIAMPDLFNTINRDLIIAAAARYRVPAIYFFRSFADSGGLVSYGPDFAPQYPQAAEYIDRILKGEKPGDLPIQMPVKVPLIINLKTANALGLDVPLRLLNAADEVIE